MVMVHSAFLPMQNGQMDDQQWLDEIESRFSAEAFARIQQACRFVQNNSDDNNIVKTHCQVLGLQIANLLLDLRLDADAIVTCILYPMLQYNELELDDIRDDYSQATMELLSGCLQMDEFSDLLIKHDSHHQLDNYRRMLLSMIDDVRIVVIKLAERAVFLRYIDKLEPTKRVEMAKQAKDIFASLANRLSILELKWEIEDSTFRVLEPESYKLVANAMNERRVEREQFVADFQQQFSQLLDAQRLTYTLYGRAKHIYSIYKKMQRKGVDYDEIYDAIAFRVLVDNITDCYTALSVIHSQWAHVPSEFDDYIATPKGNGYQSIHTVAIVGDKKRHVEIQIRTHQMHEDNEFGVAAHWLYKEGGGSEASYQRKITWLRQLLDWQREVAGAGEIPDELAQGIREDRIYVFTPTDEVVSMPVGATPLDFAYYVHTQVGHRCRGARVNHKMVPLKHQLQLGDRVEILTSKEANPSRDWLNAQQGYLHTTRARSKVHAWFRKRDYQQNVAGGQAIFHRELKRFNLQNISPKQLTKRFHVTTGDDVLAAIGCGDIRLPQLTGAFQELLNQKSSDSVDAIALIQMPKRHIADDDILVAGVENLLTHIANCCSPLPGEAIKGFVTVGGGVSVHKAECKNVLHTEQQHPERFVDVSWGKVNKQHYAATLLIEAHKTRGLLRDITRIISEHDVHLLGLNSYVDNSRQMDVINVDLEIKSTDELQQLQNRLQTIADIITIARK